MNNLDKLVKSPPEYVIEKINFPLYPGVANSLLRVAAKAEEMEVTVMEDIT